MNNSCGGKQGSSSDLGNSSSRADNTFSVSNELQRLLQQSSVKLHSQQGKPHVCGICRKAFAAFNGLRNHLLIHASTKAQTCDFCKVAFQSVSKLKLHGCPLSPPHMCGICQERFFTSEGLETHHASHIGAKPHYVFVSATGERSSVCETCRKTFPCHAALEIHRRAHTGEKPFSCHVCKKAFTTRHLLKVHFRSHIFKKPYPCEFCLKSYSTQYGLERHLLTHIQSCSPLTENVDPST